MAVSNYIPSKCKYDVRGLANGVYLLAASATKGIDIDNGEARIVSLSQAPIALEAYNVTINDTEELDERYEFSHSVSFSVNGYANELTIGERYYVIVKTKNGEYLLLNALFPCKVEYTYILGNGVSRTDFNMLTVSNHPTLPVVGYSFEAPHSCGYGYDKITRIRLNEKAYTRRDEECVYYTNGGFKEVYFDNGAEYVETYDGEYITQTLQFSIPLSTYKSSWHYNLLEFKNNNYVAVIDSENGVHFASGCKFGLQPSYEVVGGADESQVNITMSEVSSDSFLSHSEFDGNICEDDSLIWEYTDEFDGYECVGFGIAKYLLKKQYDNLHNPTGLYLCLNGYESRFPYLEIIGVFNEVVIYMNANCEYQAESGGTLPSAVTFDDYVCSSFTFSANCEWSAYTATDNITFTPSSGLANVLYEVTICNINTYTGSTIYRWYQTSVPYCSGTSKYYLEVYQYSDDGGNLWHNTDTTRLGVLAERDSSDCSSGVGIKYKRVESNGNEWSIQCTPSPLLDGVNASEYIKEVYVGDCVAMVENLHTATHYDRDLEYVSISDSVITIGDGCFSISANPSACTDVVIGNSIRYIDNNVLKNHLIKKIEIESEEPPLIFNNTFYGDNTDNIKQCPDSYVFTSYPSVFVPSGSVDTYKAAKGWENFADRIYPIDMELPSFSDFKYISFNVNDKITSAACGSNGTSFPALSDLITYGGESNHIRSRSYGYAKMVYRLLIGDCVESIGLEARDFVFKLAAKTLERVEFSNNSSLKHISSYAFSGCTNLKYINIPSSVESIGTAAFCGCSSLSGTINLPNVLKYQFNAFKDCSNLTSVVLPENTIGLYDYSFCGCTRLTSITCLAPTPPIFLGDNLEPFKNTNNCPIYVPAAYVDIYKSARGWIKYASRITAIT